MIFEGNPKELYERRSMRIRIRFNNEGKYETEDNKIITALKREGYKNNEVEEEVVVEEIKEEKQIYTCTKCGMKFDNKSDLGKHIYYTHGKGSELNNEI